MTPTTTPARAPVDAVRIELFVPVASFRDPMFPGVSRCLPVPPPSTVRGMLAAATGRPSEPLTLGLCAHARGRGVDAETYHPIAADGSNPAVGGRVRPGKGGTTLRERPFLVDLSVTVWVPEPEAERIAAALRRPVWALRLGRSQDLLHLTSITRVRLEPAERAVVGHALAPAGTHAAPQATALRLAETVSADRLDTVYGDYLWCAHPAGEQQVRGAYRDPTDGQAVWLASPEAGAEDQPGELAQVWAKSAAYSPLGRPETLTEHSGEVRGAARALAQRIGPAGVLARHPGFWEAVETAALLHDAGKVANGFQHQARGGEAWGERHEVLSLAYVDLLTRHLQPWRRRLIAAGVAFHHRPLRAPHRARQVPLALAERYPAVAEWEKKFGRDPDARPGRPRIQVPAARHRALLDWFADRLGAPRPEAERRRLWELARDAFAEVRTAWSASVSAEDGLVAVLAQGAVTLADHSASARVALQTHMPLPSDYLARMAAPYPHQKTAADTLGHLVLCAPTGSGKTEAALAWASTQIADMDGQPRLVWVLPYRASIDAARRRLANDLDPAPGHDAPDIGLLHARAALTLLTEAACPDDAPAARATAAAQARAQAHAMRTLFAQRVRVATPHQLLRAAIAGPRYASMLLEQANAVIVLDELHAYDPDVFGRICAAMGLWERLGSRIAVTSATLAPPMLELIAGPDRPSLTAPVSVHRAPPGTAPDRHRLALDDHPLAHPDSLERVRGWLTDGYSVLVVANTVTTARHLYLQLAPRARELRPGDPDAALLLHSRFRGRDRADIEVRIQDRHPERAPGEPPRRGGLVVATQALEVSLCLDFDRGASERAPVEAVAQRAGRVNRRGRHPEGPVEFRVHHTDEPHPYAPGAVDAAWYALHQAPGPLISEQTIDDWLRLAYDTEWGRAWLDQARRARDAFTAGFLTFTEPFDDRGEHAEKLDASFDTVEILYAGDVDEYEDLRRQHPLLAADLLIPIRHAQFQRLHRAGRIRPLPGTRPVLWCTDLPYDSETGLDLTSVSGPAHG
ncbi:CRISPR-associated helicase Cas3' [Streptomonospora sp. S1-112]|uniref:CRISPR-associated helicase Cas3 n=1 Tax=Streptomonospora mangrovi TaxID=2883123 RepID=A0A9X3SEQ7_9ACTN|nr:CRISPR-associated helicase Cas3' [Streptomonospora mangrovi]MDA0565212.1 CRISPR-associated helicase Cas3' [Streptomonospora mangrovi]